MLHTAPELLRGIRVQQQVTDDIEEFQRATAQWLDSILKGEKGLTINELARRSGVHRQTISRYLKPKPGHSHRMEKDNIVKIARAANVTPPEAIYPLVANSFGFNEEEAVPLEPERIPAELKPEHPGQFVWELRTRILELPPFAMMPGDLLLTDDRVDPRPGQVVRAQIYNSMGEVEQTVWRGYRPPFLVTATMDQSLDTDPVLMQHGRFAIMGTVIRMQRLA